MKDKLMMHRATIFFLCALSAFVVPGCVKYHKIMKSEVPQGQDRPEHHEVTQAYLRSCAFYDQFKTLAFFDVLWLSDQLKTTYVNMVSSRQGKDAQAREALLRRQLEENMHWMSFLVLADIRDNVHIALSEKDSSWSMFLQMADGEKVQSVSVKEIELDPEYQLMFGSRFNLFKKAYLVKFPAKPLEGAMYLDRGNEFKMTIKSTKKMESIVWQKDVQLTQKEVHSNEDFYWG